MVYLLVRLEGDSLFFVVMSKAGSFIASARFSITSLDLLLALYLSNLASKASNRVLPLLPNFGGSNKGCLRTALALLPTLLLHDRDLSDLLAPFAFLRADFWMIGSSKATLPFLERLRVGGVSFTSRSKSISSLLPNRIDFLFYFTDFDSLSSLKFRLPLSFTPSLVGKNSLVYFYV